MATQSTLELQQSQPVTALAGCWKLEAGRATTLQPHQAGMFRVARGQVWVTFDGPHQGAGNEQGDQVLRAGEQIALKPGQRAVVEPWFIGAIDKQSPPAYFSWEPARQMQRSSSRSSVAVDTPWHGGVVQPVRDLAVALGVASGALGRLVLGLGRWSGSLVARRGVRPSVVHLH